MSSLPLGFSPPDASREPPTPGTARPSELTGVQSQAPGPKVPIALSAPHGIDSFLTDETKGTHVNLQLTREQAEELAELLETCLRDLSVEIADTTNPDYRDKLRARRDRLTEVDDALRAALGA